ncbi:hypothetical protein [Paraburkholderia guartelaensis]|uniref:hypothetical protein n=1 Tax=Paraburkholderia guartelaensis TaxID=2546446 RepID=UPI002AB741E3|nr:hypothetical protein [Paraburkholderia guartelaensis]
MRKLTVTMRGDHFDARLLALPFDVYGPHGEPVGRGVVSPTEPATVILAEAADDMPRAHVLAKRPDGEQLQSSTNLGDGPNHVILVAGANSPHEWLQWVTPFRSLEHLSPRDAGGDTRLPARRVGPVWVTVWAIRANRWIATDMRPQQQQRGDGARLIVLDVPACPHTLQVGGDDVAWRLVSLPPNGPVRVALTRRATEDGDSIDVTVGRVSPGNELIMSYLSSGGTTEAAQLAEAWQAADVALYKKMEDPVSAAAGAYVLLKMNRLDERRQWVSNLVEWFPYLADGPIVAAALALQRKNPDKQSVRKYIAQAMERGLPVFSIGISTLVETMAAIHRGKRESKSFQMWYQAARAYLQARASKGAYLSFYGRSPAEPSWTRIYGRADEPTPLANKDLLGNDRIFGPWGNFGTIAPSLERALITSTKSSSTDDWLRLGLARQYRLPAEGGLQLFREVGSSALGLEALPASAVGSDWNSQRERHSFMVFDGDE